MKTWIKKVLGFGLASFFSDFSHEMTISFVPIIVAQFIDSAKAPLFLGIISGVTDAFASFLRIISGFLSDRFSRKKPLIAFGYFLTALFSTLTGFAHSIGQIISYRVLAFTGSGLREPPRDAVIATVIEPKNYGRAFGLKNAMDTLGSLVGPLVAFAFTGIVSMQGIFLLSFIPGILAMFTILFFTDDVYVPRKKTVISADIWRDFLRLPRSFIILLLIFFIFDLSTFNKLLLLGRTQDILEVNKNHIPSLLVLLYAIFNLTRAIGEFAIGLLSDYVSRIILLALLGCGVSAIVAFLLTASHATFTFGLLMFSLAGISAAAKMTLKKASAADMLPPEIRGLGYGVLQASEGLGTLLANILIGFIWTTYSPLAGFSYAMIMSIIAMILLLLFFIMWDQARAP